MICPVTPAGVPVPLTPHRPDDQPGTAPDRGRIRGCGAAAVRLFVERARAVRADFALTDGNAADIVAICRRLAGACQDERRDGYLCSFHRDGVPQTEERTGQRTPGSVPFGLGEAPAQFVVQEPPPDGFGPPVVFCSQTFANGGASPARKMEVSVAHAIGFG